MAIQKNQVVTVHYTLKDDAGELLDASQPEDPLAYINGSGMMIPAFEDEVSKHEKGERFTFTIDAENGYGDFDESMVQSVPKEQFEGMGDLEVGMQFQVGEDESDEDALVVTVTEVSEDSVTVDGNHPLAGENLVFEVEILEIRDATAEEIAHGHVH